MLHLARSSAPTPRNRHCMLSLYRVHLENRNYGFSPNPPLSVRQRKFRNCNKTNNTIIHSKKQYTLYQNCTHCLRKYISQKSAHTNNFVIQNSEETWHKCAIHEYSVLALMLCGLLRCLPYWSAGSQKWSVVFQKLSAVFMKEDWHPQDPHGRGMTPHTVVCSAVP